MQEGSFIHHNYKPEWGLGKIIKVDKDGNAHIFFLGCGLKKLKNDPHYFSLVTSITNHPILDGIRSISDKSTSKYRTLQQMVDVFLGIFPQGFNDPDYFSHERNYKWAAHESMVELLDEKEFTALLNSKNYDEIVKRALRIVNLTNLIFPNEKMALRDGLKSTDHQEFAEL